MSLSTRLKRLARAVGVGGDGGLRLVVLAPVPAGQPVGPPRREGSRLTLPYPDAGPFPPLPKQALLFKLIAGFDPADLV